MAFFKRVRPSSVINPSLSSLHTSSCLERDDFADKLFRWRRELLEGGEPILPPLLSEVRVYKTLLRSLGYEAAKLTPIFPGAADNSFGIVGFTCEFLFAASTGFSFQVSLCLSDEASSFSGQVLPNGFLIGHFPGQSEFYLSLILN
jgi:hypothetical protein